MNINDGKAGHGTSCVGHDDNAFAIEQITRQDDVFYHFRVELSASVSHHLHVAFFEPKNGMGDDTGVHAREQQQALTRLPWNALGVKRGDVVGVCGTEFLNQRRCFSHTTKAPKVAFCSCLGFESAKSSPTPCNEATPLWW